jgi:hypothetical protein
MPDLTEDTEASVREDVNSIFYTYRQGLRAVTLTVLKIGERPASDVKEFIACDLTTHVAAPTSEWCSTISSYAACCGEGLPVARSFYRALQTGGNTERVEDERVLEALSAHLRDM